MARPNLILGDNKWATKSGGLLGYTANINKNVSPVEFDFSRASSGTVVNKQGLIELVDKGAELVADVDFSLTGTQAANITGWYWTTGSGWTISDGKATCDGTSAFALERSLSTVNTVLKQITFTVSDYQSGKLRVYSGAGADVLFEVTSNGTYTYTDSLLSNRIFIYSIQAFIGSVSSVSVKEVLEEYPRIDFSDDVNGALLLEPSSTNLMPYSQNLEAAVWGNSAGASLYSSNVLSPDGITAAYVAKSGVVTDFVSDIYTGTIGTTYTSSTYIKNIDSVLTKILVRNTISGASAYIYWDGAVLVSITDIRDVTTFTDEGNGWYRIKTTYVAVEAPQRTRYYPSDTTDPTDTNKSILLWGSQLEALPYATSYIPTHGVAATRVAEVCNNGGVPENFSNTEGTLFLDVESHTSGVDHRISISDGTLNNRVTFAFAPEANKAFLLVRFNSTYAIYNLDVHIGDHLTRKKVAISYKSGDTKVYVNGYRILHSTVGFSSGNLTKLSLSGATGSPKFHGKVYKVAVYGEALPDEQLAILTDKKYNSFGLMSNELNYTSI